MFLTPESVRAGPASGSAAARWTVTAELCQSESALSEELGLPVSILTVAELWGGSAEGRVGGAWWLIGCSPSLGGMGGAETTRAGALPATVWVATPSTEYSMFLTPESVRAGPASGSAAARWTVTAELCQSESALSEELGLPVSILTVAELWG